MSSLYRARRPFGAKRRWGYLVWLIAGIVIGVPEITAAVDHGALPFTTISGMTGHLERHHSWVELIVIALIALLIYSTTRLRPAVDTAGPVAASAGGLTRTVGGRLTVRPQEPKPARAFDDETAPRLFALCAACSLVAIGFATWAADRWWHDNGHYHPAYVLYGSLGLLWLLIPSLVAFALGADTPFPTLLRTIRNLEDWLRGRHWPGSLGALAAWLVSYLIFAGLVILLLHLTLYPFPDITTIINPNG